MADVEQPQPSDPTAAVQAAVDAVLTRHREHGVTDIAESLERELARRDVQIDDDAWLAEMAEHIRRGTAVVFGDEPGGDAG
ncbi:hypothetical protein [Nocardioides euryhalodurans]|uniref:Uncharacterized protein n=1 Tax=Nocardioides euryhalodurans TaxID=2518370 RepID=A0A4P7GGE1_9ACTN|nr:hypothetical protein [Nocardioides euryhalodurans]QBR90918.1 hypothetical protein EXE57_00520 [Nocardioides euryhalodurans]